MGSWCQAVDNQENVSHHFQLPGKTYQWKVTPGLQKMVCAGRLLHSHNYRENSSFKGQRVVIMGASASGQDISRDIAQVADEVMLEPPPSPPLPSLGARAGCAIRMVI